MRISYPNGLILEVSEAEAREIFYCMKERMIKNIKSHWINYPDSFLSSESTALRVLRILSKIVDYFYETEILPEFLELLNKTKISKQKGGEQIG